MIDPVSIALVTLTALAAAGGKDLVGKVWQHLSTRLKKQNQVTITSPSGQKVNLDTSLPMTDERIKEIIDQMK